MPIIRIGSNLHARKVSAGKSATCLLPPKRSGDQGQLSRTRLLLHNELAPR